MLLVPESFPVAVKDTHGAAKMFPAKGAETLLITR
jgi:hypothetical protein